MPRRTIPLGLFLLTALAAASDAQDGRQGANDLAVAIVRATYRLENPKTTGTGFVLRRDQEEGAPQLLLITAAHAFEQMSGDTLTLVSRREEADGAWVVVPMEVPFRRAEKNLWVRHEEHDVAVLQLPELAAVESVPLEMLATPDMWKQLAPAPGDLVRCVGFPHAAQFKPSKAGFPLTRLGCVASYPLWPLDRYPTFLVDYNAFEGDSGGPVYLQRNVDGKSVSRIVGLVHAQHFLDEKYQTVYQKGEIRKRLGVAIIANSLVIRETIARLLAREMPPKVPSED